MLCRIVASGTKLCGARVGARFASFAPAFTNPGGREKSDVINYTPLPEPEPEVPVSEVWTPGMVAEMKMVDGRWTRVKVSRVFIDGSVAVSAEGVRVLTHVTDIDKLRAPQSVLSKVDRYTPVRFTVGFSWLFVTLLPGAYFCWEISEHDTWSNSIPLSIRSAKLDPAYDLEHMPQVLPKPDFIPLVWSKKRIDEVAPHVPQELPKYPPGVALY
eukprot:Rhum_TRINITY_DN21751_c0_g1::Rhum_TRINITY_DN21751_c0_g1_i1::g.174622::m.174622